MSWTERDEHVWNDLQEWRQSLFEYEPTDIENTYDKWMEQALSVVPESVLSQVFEKFDNSMFQLNSLLRESKLQKDAQERIILTARSMKSDIEELADMQQFSVDQLTFLAEQQASKHRLYSFVEGAMAGSGKKILAGSDLIAMAVINLRAIQLIAMSFGYSVQSPSGLLETLKVFHTATLPERLKMFGWEDLIQDIQLGDEQFYYGEHDRLTDSSWLDEPLMQILKVTLVMTLSNRKKTGIPLLAMGIGAGYNYKTTRDITKFAVKYYQFKHLFLKGGGEL